MMITSQRYIDQDTVDAKINDSDYVVMLATIADSDGNEYDLVVDGHHSYAAAIQSGNAPVYEYSDYNYQAEVDCLGFDDFMASKWIDSEYYDIETGVNVW